jgi:hypothetical protein
MATVPQNRKDIEETQVPRIRYIHTSKGTCEEVPS